MMTKSKTVRIAYTLRISTLPKSHSDLIILSGCQTADGLLKAGEGLLSLTNAFKYAGAKSLTCSLWKTENIVTNKIISDYTVNLDQGQSKDNALRSAKLTFINTADPLLKHPFYWSTFVNVGNQEPISFSANTLSLNSAKLPILLAKIILGLGILFFFYNKMKKKRVTF